jgi:hypothetical protein
MKHTTKYFVTVVSENKLSRTNYMVTVDAEAQKQKFLSYALAKPN